MLVKSFKVAMFLMVMTITKGWSLESLVSTNNRSALGVANSTFVLLDQLNKSLSDALPGYQKCQNPGMVIPYLRAIINGLPAGAANETSEFFVGVNALNETIRKIFDNQYAEGYQVVLADLVKKKDASQAILDMNTALLGMGIDNVPQLQTDIKNLDNALNAVFGDAYKSAALPQSTVDKGIKNIINEISAVNLDQVNNAEINGFFENGSNNYNLLEIVRRIKARLGYFCINDTANPNNNGNFLQSLAGPIKNYNLYFFTLSSPAALDSVFKIHNVGVVVDSKTNPQHAQLMMEVKDDQGRCYKYMSNQTFSFAFSDQPNTLSCNLNSSIEDGQAISFSYRPDLQMPSSPMNASMDSQPNNPVQGALSVIYRHTDSMNGNRLSSILSDPSRYEANNSRCVADVLCDWNMDYKVLVDFFNANQNTKVGEELAKLTNVNNLGTSVSALATKPLPSVEIKMDLDLNIPLSKTLEGLARSIAPDQSCLGVDGTNSLSYNVGLLYYNIGG